MTALSIAKPVDAKTASLLALIAGDPIHATDRATVCDAIIATAGANHGLVDPNRLRALLTDTDGQSRVYPAVIGAVVCALRHKGVLAFAGYVDTTGSRSGNTGKLARSYWFRAPKDGAL